jgi:predicted phage baseplate assembly protein
VDFDFLPKLPKPNLDDRTFKDLVEECILRIPRYCPEWTNYNPSDPGITLIELFAWLTDQMLLRFNQVPLRNYVTFLELLGVRLQAPAPAQTDITFYLSTALPDAYTIPGGTEVATVRTETEEAIVFSTDEPLTIDKPSLRHFLTAETTEDTPQILRDRFTNLWTLRSDGEWGGRELALFDEQPSPNNCFYLVFDPEAEIEGNVVAVSFRGEAATTTGINPEAPPRCWEAWNGTYWQSILLQEADDGTKGFSFSEIAQASVNALQGADVVLHLPTRWPVTRFTTYQGRWLRCVYTTPELGQPGYSSSPRMVALAVRSIGGTVISSQSSLVRNELLGESDGHQGRHFNCRAFRC